MTDQSQHPTVPQSEGASLQARQGVQDALDVAEEATRRTAAAVHDAAQAARGRTDHPVEFIQNNGDPAAVQTLSSIDFNSLIGGPLLAGVNASAQAAMATAQYIQTIGFTGTGSSLTVNTVQFTYATTPPGQTTSVTSSVTVPLLAILPIPYLRVESMDIDFKAQINSMTSVTNTNSFGVTSTVNGSTGGFLSLFESAQFSVSVADTNVNTAVSQQTANYSMDVHVHAGVDPMPSGMQAVLNILQGMIQSQATA
jgi:hypothetical protein